jgi:hypothetical protein
VKPLLGRFHVEHIKNISPRAKTAAPCANFHSLAGATPRRSRKSKQFSHFCARKRA